jgi:hypothetical protein
MKSSLLYIYHGNVLISVGDILSVNYSSSMSGSGLYVIRSMKQNEKGDWLIEVNPIKVTGQPNRSYTDLDLDDLFEHNELEVYHKAGR